MKRSLFGSKYNWLKYLAVRHGGRRYPAGLGKFHLSNSKGLVLSNGEVLLVTKSSQASEGDE